MLTSSIDTANPSQNLADVRDPSNCCQACGAKVDLTKSMRVKKDRIVGCPDCDWGAARSGNA